MKETDCRYKKTRLDMVAPHCLGKVEYCELLKGYPSTTVCKHCEWQEPPLLQTISNFINDISLKKL